MASKRLKTPSDHAGKAVCDPDATPRLDAPPQDALERDDVENQLRSAEERIRQLESDLETACRLASLGTLAAGIAHEINNLLSPALAYAQYASTRKSDTELMQKALGHTVRSVRQATTIAENILGYAGRVDKNPVANVRECFAQARACLVRKPESDGITFHVELPDDLTAAIRPTALQQIFFNLLLNAVTAMRPQRRGTIRVAGESDRDGYITITFADSGPGIPNKTRSSLFKPFANRLACTNDWANPGSGGIEPAGCGQGAPPPTDETAHAPGEAGGAGGAKGECAEPHEGGRGGSGLGLTVCRMLTARADGSIHLHETSEAGTTFVIHLPQARRDEEARQIESDRDKTARNAA